MNPSYFAGIDVSKLHLDVHVLPNNVAQRFDNHAVGHRALIAFLRKHQVCLTVLEYTGGYEHAAVIAMVEAGLAVHVAQPVVIHAFARSLKLHAKNDQIDAALCGRYAQDRGHELRVIARIDKTLEKLRALVVRRDQLVDMHSDELKREQQVLDKAVAKSIQRSLKSLKKEIAQVEKQADDLIQADQVLQAKAQVLRTVKSVGPQTVRMVLGCLPELGAEPVKRIHALVGVAPYAADSGQSRGTRHIAGGRMLVRNGLYMTCMSAISSNPVIAPYYRRLTQDGLKHKSAMMACIRKLLAYLDKQIRSLSVPPTTAPPTPPTPAL